MVSSRRRDVLRLAGSGVTAGVTGCVRISFTDDDGPDASAGDCEVDAPAAEGVHDVGGGWPMAGYDPARTYYAPDRRVPELDELDVAWTHQSSGADALISGETVLASTDDAFVAFDAISGQRRWTLRGEEELHNSRFALRDGTAYCARTSWDRMESVFVAIDLETGDEQWRTEMNQLPSSEFTATERELIFGTYTGRVGNWQGDIRSLDRGDGSYRWVNDSIERYTSSPPAVTRDAVYVGLRNRDLIALDRETGGECFTIDSRDTEAVSVYGGTVYVTRRVRGSSSSWGVFEVRNGSDGSRRWTIKPWDEPIETVTSQIITDEHVLLTGFDEIFALTHDGSPAWERTHVDGGPVTTGSTIVVGDTLLTGGSRGIFTFDIPTGDLQGTIPVTSGSVSGLKVANGTVYVTDADGELSIDGEPPSALLALR